MANDADRNSQENSRTAALMREERNGPQAHGLPARGTALGGLTPREWYAYDDLAVL